jgi:hypothetical protein
LDTFFARLPIPFAAESRHLHLAADAGAAAKEGKLQDDEMEEPA